MGCLHRRGHRLRDRVRGLDRDLGARDPDAGAAHAPDRHDGERHATRPHRAALGVAAAHAGARRPPVHLLEYRFAEAGAAVAGFVLLVPHYLGDTEYPAAALAALDSITVATGLVFDGRRPPRREPRLPHEGRPSRSRAATSCPGCCRASKSATTPTWRARPLRRRSSTPAICPSADELAAELERFLATRPRGDDDKRGPTRNADASAGVVIRASPGIVRRARRM